MINGCIEFDCSVTKIVLTWLLSKIRARMIESQVLLHLRRLFILLCMISLIPPPTIPPSVKPGVLTSPKYSITSRKQLLANHFKLTVKAPDSVHITSENKKAAQGKGIGRKLVDRLYQTYSSKLADNKFVYDKEKALYTVGPLPQNKLDFTVPVEKTFAKRKM